MTAAGGAGGARAWLRRAYRGTRRRLAEGPVERLRELVQLRARLHLLRGRVRHLHGPVDLPYGDDELLVMCVVRNGGAHVDAYVAHHRALGARHLVFLDNGSTDDTVARLRAHGEVTVLQTDAPYQRYENTMKRYLAERFSRGRWNLIADIDEHFDYPGSDRLPLRDFLRYLNANGYTAVTVQLLDLFADRPLDAPAGDDEDLVDTYRWYDVSDVVTGEHRLLPVPDPRIRFHWGGIRRTAFGTLNGLTKAALVRLDGRVEPFVGWHHARRARYADLSCVLRHYPFVPTFRGKVQDAVRTGRYGRVTSDEYAAYWAGLARQPGINLRRETAREWTSVDDLVASGFLVVSDAYRAWVREHATAGVPAAAP